MAATLDQAAIDRANATFWNELCGTTMAASAGITDRSAESLRRFDDAYLSFYPYLGRYLRLPDLAGRRVLEIGLGYGTVGEAMARAGARYTGVDIAAGPVEMMRYRLGLLSMPQRALRASAALLPFPSASFDVVVSIGCLHHTGQLEACVAEVHRILRPGGTAMVMVYNQFSYRRWMRSPIALFRAWNDERIAPPRDRRGDEQQRRLYDANQQGDAAPETVFVSERRARDLFRRFGTVAVAKENCDDIVRGGRHLRLRDRLLTVVGPRMGLDLYITATK